MPGKVAAFLVTFVTSLALMPGYLALALTVVLVAGLVLTEARSRKSRCKDR